MVSFPIVIWACTAGAAKRAPTASAAAFFFIVSSSVCPPRACSAMENIDRDDGTGSIYVSHPIVVKLVAARLERAADLARHLGLRQRNTLFLGHRGDDLHVVLGPGHGLPAPLLERVVGGARHEQRPAQLLHIHAVALRQRQAL